MHKTIIDTHNKATYILTLRVSLKVLLCKFKNNKLQRKCWERGYKLQIYLHFCELFIFDPVMF